jgi:hypothetical protein
MTLPISRVNDYISQTNIYAYQWEEEFELWKAELNRPPYVIIQHSFFKSGASAIDKSDGFVVIGPYNGLTNHSLEHLRMIFQGGTLTVPFDILVYKNGVLSQTITVPDATVATPGSFPLSPIIRLEEGDWAHIEVPVPTDITFASYQFLGTQEGYGIFPFVRGSFGFQESQLIQSASLNAELTNIVTALNNIRFLITKGVFYPGEPDVVDINTAFICPPTRGLALQKIKAIFRAGAETNTVTIELRKNGVAVGEISFVPGDPVDTVKSVDISPAVTLYENDRLTWHVTDDSGDQRHVSVWFSGDIPLNFDETGVALAARVWSATTDVIPLEVIYQQSQDVAVTPNEGFELELDNLATDLNTGRVPWTNEVHLFNPQSTDKFMELQSHGGGSTGNNVILKGAKIIFQSGSAVGNKTFNILVNGAVKGTLGLSGAGDPIDTVKSTDFTDVPLQNSDVIKLDCTAGGGSQRDITFMVWGTSTLS